MKGRSNKEGLVLFKDLVLEIDLYDIEIHANAYYEKHLDFVSLKDLIAEDSVLMIGLKPKHIFQINIQLEADGIPLTGAEIKISNTKMSEELEDIESHIANGNMIDCSLCFRKNKLLEICY